MSREHSIVRNQSSWILKTRTMLSTTLSKMRCLLRKESRSNNPSNKGNKTKTPPKTKKKTTKTKTKVTLNPRNRRNKLPKHNRKYKQ